MDNATSALARMNMVLHDCPTAEIWQDNTLSHPHFKNADGGLKTFLIPTELIVARYFATEQAAIEQIETKRDAISRQMEELDDAHGR